MNEALADLVGQKVRVYSTGASQGWTDDGVLEAWDHPWLRIRKNNGETLCLAVYSIRLIKALGE
ncbi:MAG: hypothetical protein ACK47B_12955 [Armatimonadota bacterium]